MSNNRTNKTIAHIFFDTLLFAKKLQAAGLEQKYAAAQAEVQAELFSILTQERFATKEELQQLQAAVKEDVWGNFN